MTLSDQRRFLLISLMMFAGAVLLGLSLLPGYASQAAVEGVLLVLLAVSCIAPPLAALLRGRLDIFEPVYPFLISAFVYFVLIPVVLISSDAFFISATDYRPELRSALFLALLAQLGFMAGYYWEHGHKPAEEAGNGWPRFTVAEPLRKPLWLLALVMLFGFTVMVFLWIVVAGFPLESLWIFGEASYSDAFSLATGPQIGYLYGAREALPACILLLVALRKNRKWPIAAAILLAAVALFFSGAGARFRVLLLLLGIFAYYYLERRKRPGLASILLVSFLLFYFVVGAIGFYRGVTLGVGASLRGLSVSEDPFTVSQAWETMVEGSQIAVSTAAMARYIPSRMDYLWGKSMLNVFTQPIPRILWPGKPDSIGLEGLKAMWPPGTTLPFWALFYINFSYLGVVVGTALWGWLSRRIYLAYIHNPGNPFAMIQLALYYPYVIHMYGRGGDNLAFIVYGLVYILVPVWLAYGAYRFLERRAADWATDFGNGLNGKSR